MIPCPKCGGDTRVLETRVHKRRRICKDISCAARISTTEVPSEDLVLVRKLFDSMEWDREP